MRISVDLESIKIRQFTSYIVDHSLDLFKRSDLVLKRDTFVRLLTLFDEYFVNIFHRGSQFYNELVWGCSPDLRDQLRDDVDDIPPSLLEEYDILPTEIEVRDPVHLWDLYPEFTQHNW